MNLPYQTANDAVEFWHKVAEAMNDDVEFIAGMILLRCNRLGEVSAYTYRNDRQGLSAFTRDMLARCVLWLAERGVWVRPILNIEYRAERTDGEDDFGRSERVKRIATGKCIFTSTRNAVLAVSGEGGG